MKRHPEINEIYDRFLKNEATAAELDQLFTYFENGKDAELRQLIAINLIADAADEPADSGRKLLLADLHMKINSKIDAISGDSATTSIKKYPILAYFNSPGYKIAASLLLVAFLSFFVYKFQGPSNTVEIKPGGNYATLSIADGKKIDLKRTANESIAKIQGVSIRKTRDGQIVYSSSGNYIGTKTIWNSIVTPLGGKFRITLSDGSIVMLNSGSKLEFPVGFHGVDRLVKLTGEAYFEVVKDPSKPFIVVSGQGRTEVLGTKFNVSSYPEDGLIKTTLLEGKVKFSRNNTKDAAVLKPGEQAVLSGNHVQVLSVNAEDFMAWKDNKFVFKNEKLSVIMRQLSRWYNIEVDYNSLPDRRLYASIAADVNLSEVIRMLSVTSNLKFNVDGRRISVIK